MGIQQGSRVLPLLGGQRGEMPGGVLQSRDEVVVDGFVAVGLGERGGGADCSVHRDRAESGSGDRQEVTAVHCCSQGLSESGHGAVGSERDGAVGSDGNPVRPVVGADDVRGRLEPKLSSISMASGPQHAVPPALVNHFHKL